MIKRISEHKSPDSGEKRGEKPLHRAERKRKDKTWFLGVFLFSLSVLYLSLGNSVTVSTEKRELPVYSVERKDNKIAISFDAAWGGEKTKEILSILDEFGVHATFFLVDTWSQRFPELVKEIDAGGHEIGNHSTTHPHMNKLSREEIIKELDTMSDNLFYLTGKRPCLFRAPYGEYNNKVISTVRMKGYQAVQWSVDSLDWKNKGTQDLINRAVGNIQQGDIVLFHNDSACITQALPEILSIYQRKGLEVVPVSQLLLPEPYTIDFRGCQKIDQTKIPEVAQ